MARATYRRRPDGVFVIVQHRRWQRAAIGFLTMLLALALVIAFSAALTLYTVLALPVLLSLGAFFLVKHRRRRAALQASAPPTSLPARTATLHRVRDAGA
jgi:hypothetical protein